MSTNNSRKPSAASESFITALAVLFFIALAILFLWLDDKKSVGHNAQYMEQPASSRHVSGAVNRHLSGMDVVPQHIAMNAGA